ncbi:glycine cleavage system aminomethyltransferase GcvT [Alphaproteobacteria bacterium]|nr:glycine cleavage system aminomethyltransferase GcvT [Alphaproteobacteria bacterium]
MYLKKFHELHKAKFVPFAGYEMPINYKTGIINEHLHVRKHSGIFDVSHMGQVLIPFTKENIKSLENFIPLDLQNIPSNKSHYSFILNASGGIVDDLMLSKIIFNQNEYIYAVYNSSRKNVIKEIFEKTIRNYQIIEDRCLIAIQGPKSFLFLNNILNLSKNTNFLDIDLVKFNDSDVIISRSGYTGEDGFELSILNKDAEKLLTKLLQNNIILCGLGCRDSLRVEAGLSLYGNEINESISPLQAGLSWVIDKDRLLDNSLNCSSFLTKQFNSPISIKKIGFIPINKIMLRSDMLLFNKLKKEIGYITSGCYSPILKCSIGIGYINKISEMSETIFVNIRNKFEELKIEKIPFIRKNYKKEA